MLIFDQLRKADRPLRFIAWGVAAGVLVLLAGLWRVQVHSHGRYQESARNQSFRTVRVPAMRGRILDRLGRPLADNSPRYRLEIYLDELRQQFDAEDTRLRRLRPPPSQAARSGGSTLSRLVSRFRRKSPAPAITREERDGLRRLARYHVVSNLVSQAGAHLGLQLALNETALHKHWTEKRALPLTILDQLTPAQVAMITEQGWSLPGVSLEYQPIRQYPQASLAAHLIGQLRRDDDDNDDARYDYHLRDYRGVAGLEGALDHQLRGTPGARAILVNSAGYRHRQAERMILDPESGSTVVTTLDIDVQRTAEQALASLGAETRGAVVVMDPRNGDILALVSAPAYNPNRFLEGLTQAEVDQLYDTRLRPAINRATTGTYQPGSTFKIITALALLDTGILTPESIHDRFTVRDRYSLGTRRIEDTAPPGDYDFRRAFIKSSNSYFIDYGLKLGLKRLLEMGHRFHFGEKTGLKINEEASGSFPDYEDVRNAWTQGNLANVSIGQEITISPLQMAVAISAVANGGRILWPRVVDRIEPTDNPSRDRILRVKPGQVRTDLGLSPVHLEIVRTAMRDDVGDHEGTGHDAHVPGFNVCGKTGTAEIKQGSRLIDKVTWFASFAPFENPRYTVIVVVESGMSGSRTCAPVAQRIYRNLRERDLRQHPEVAAQ